MSANEDHHVCEQCKADVHPLAIFPGRTKHGVRCLDCYRPDGERMARQMTAPTLARMWGAR